MKCKILVEDNFSKTIAIIYTKERYISDGCFEFFILREIDLVKNLKIYKVCVSNISFNLQASNLNNIFVAINNVNFNDIKENYNIITPLNYIIPYNFKYPALIILKNNISYNRGIWYSHESFTAVATSAMSRKKQASSIKRAKKYFYMIKIKNILNNEEI